MIRFVFLNYEDHCGSFLMPLSRVHWRGKKVLFIICFLLYIILYVQRTTLKSQADANGVVFTSQVVVLLFIYLFIYLCKKEFLINVKRMD